MVNEVQIVSLYMWTCEGPRFATKTGSKVKDVRMEDGRKGALKAVETAVSCGFFGARGGLFPEKNSRFQGSSGIRENGKSRLFSESPTKNESPHGDHCCLGSTPR